MATLTIRNLPEDVVTLLKEQARRNGRSMEQEAREILGRRLVARNDVLAEMRAKWAEMNPTPSASEVDNWIEASRRAER